MATVNPLVQWKETLNDPTARTIATVQSVSGDAVQCILRGGGTLTASSAGGSYTAGDTVLIENGAVKNKVSNLPQTEQGV